MKKQDTLDFSLKLLFKTSIFVFFGLFFSKVFSYIYRIIIARYLGAEIYGLYSLALVIIGTLMALGSLGFIEGTLRYFSFYRGKNELDKINYLHKFASTVLIISTIAISIISFILAEPISLLIFHSSELVIFLRVFSILIPFWIFASYYLAIMRSFERVKQHSLIENILQLSVKVGVLVFFVVLGYKTNAVILSFFLGIFAIFLGSYLYCKIKLPKVFRKAKLENKEKQEIISSFISYSWPVMFLGVIAGILYWIDSFMIGVFKTATEVGFYNAVVPIALLLNLAPEIFIQLLFPLITREYSLKKVGLIKELTKQTGKWIFMVNLPFFLLMIIFPGAVINLLFGAEYLVASTALRFLLIGTLASSLFVISNNLLSMAGKSRIILLDIVLASIINIILNMTLVPLPTIFGIDNSLGINGAAISTMISLIIFNILFAVQAKHYTSIFPLRRKVIRIAIISIIPLLILFIIRRFIQINTYSALALSFLFLAIYALLLFVFKAFDNNDKIILQAIKNRIINLRTK